MTAVEPKSDQDTITVRNPADGRVAGTVPIDGPDTVAEKARELRLFQPEWEAIGELAEIHDRMPLVVDEGDWDRWLDPDEPAAPDLLAAPPDISGITMREVSTLVNSVRNNGPELIEPAEPDNQPVGLF